MVLKIQHFVIFITIGCVLSCKQSPPSVAVIEGHLLPITDSLVASDSIDTFVTPYRNRIEMVLDSALTYASKTISKDDGQYNSTAGNLMADIVMTQAEPIFKSRTGRDIDFVFLNHGGIRAIMSKGNISARTAYEVMPFDNSIVVVELSGNAVEQLIKYLIASGRAHPISGLQVILNKEGLLSQANIQGKPFDPTRHYFVATSDYLSLGGDQMDFFLNPIGQTGIDYQIRNALIDYFKKVDTLSPSVDDRYYKMK